MPNNLERYRNVLIGMAQGINPSKQDVHHIQSLSQRELLFLMKKLIMECESAYNNQAEYDSPAQEIIYQLCLGLKEPKMNDEDYAFFIRTINNAAFFDCLLDNPLFPLKYLLDDSLFDKFKNSIFNSNIEKRRKLRVRSYNKHEIVYCLREQLSEQLGEAGIESMSDEMVIKVTGFNTNLLNEY